MPDPSTIDLVAPFDPTGYTSITGAQLLQLVSGLFPAKDKGFIVFSEDDKDGLPQVPDANETVKWQKYVWLRQSDTSTGIYIWCKNKSANFVHSDELNADVNFLQWYPVGISTIGKGSITGDLIAPAAITDININDVDWSKISNAPAFVPTPNSVTAGMLIDGSVIASKIANNGLAGYIPRISVDGITLEFFKQNEIVKLDNPVAANMGLPVVVNANGTGFTIAATWGGAGSGTNRSIAYGEEHISRTAYSNATTVNTGVIPVVIPGGLVAELSIDPVDAKANDTLVVEACLQVGASAGTYPVIGFIVDEDDNCVAVASASVTNNNCISSLYLFYKITLSADATKSFSIYFGPGGVATATVNKTGNNTTPHTWGGMITSFSKLTVYR